MGVCTGMRRGVRATGTGAGAGADRGVMEVRPLMRVMVMMVLVGKFVVCGGFEVRVENAVVQRPFMLTIVLFLLLLHKLPLLLIGVVVLLVLLMMMSTLLQHPFLNLL